VLEKNGEDQWDQSYEKVKKYYIGSRRKGISYITMKRRKAN
jgi:hypothetical protein